MKHVIMVCTGNICRSPMAAGLLAHRLPEHLKSRIDVSSAGTNALQGYPAQDHAIEAMADIGIDISGHRARQLTHELAHNADWILTMEMAHLRFVKNWSHIPSGNLRLLLEFAPDSQVRQVADPYGGPLAAYQTCLETLKPAVEGVIEALKSITSKSTALKGS